MAPVFQFALAALAATSVLAAPLPTPTGSADILQPRGFIDDLLQELNPFGKYVDGKTKVKTKDMLENALEVEKQLRGQHDKRDEGEVKKEYDWLYCSLMPFCHRPKKDWQHEEGN